jgi:hypothetical protein
MHVVVVLIHVGPPCFSYLHLWTCGEQSVGFGCGFVWGTSNQTRFPRLERESSNANVRFATCCNPSPSFGNGWMAWLREVLCSVDMIVHILCVWDWRAVFLML